MEETDERERSVDEPEGGGGGVGGGPVGGGSERVR
jgi:hypothetical protein